MTTNKWLPPLLCPIPLNHPCHYNYSPTGHLNALLSRLSSGKTYYKSYKTDWQKLFDDRLSQPDTYYRLFAKRTADKKVKPRKPKAQYVIYSPNGKFIKHDYTLKDSKHYLAMDFVTVQNRFRKRIKKEVPVGSYILKIVDDPEVFNWEVPTIHDLAPVAVKRCKECPNKTSTQGICTCGFWSAIRDNTESKVWWPIHDRRMYDIRKKKEHEKTKKISIRLSDLLKSH